MGVIYRYTSPEKKSYIGQTIHTPQQRAGVNGRDYKKCRYFFEAIEKFGFDALTLDILEECSNELLDEREQYWIRYYNTVYPNGYNATNGGQKNVRTWSKPVYQFSQKGELIKRYNSLTEAAFENKCNVASLSEVCSGRKVTCLGYFWSYENTPPKPKKNFRNKRVYQFDENGYLLKEFETVANAAHYCNVPYYQINFCVSKRGVKRVKNTIFTYEPYVDWNYYTLKHNRSTTTIPNGSISQRREVPCSTTKVDEDIVSSCEKS